MPKNEAVFTRGSSGKSIRVERLFDAALPDVWDAWTEAEILDRWWAPKPYRAETKKMDFRAGGQWLYAMVGPEGDTSWCRVDYTDVDAPQSVSSTVMFCDEEGNENTGFPRMYWKQSFTEQSGQTKVVIDITYDTEADLQKIVELGFEQGFSMGLDNLDEVLAA